MKNAVSRLDFWPNREAINTDYSEGSAIDVPQHDGAIIKLRKTAGDYDPTDRINAQLHIAKAAAKGEVLTGLALPQPRLRRPPRPPQHLPDGVQYA